jgi:hypothetical protein
MYVKPYSKLLRACTDYSRTFDDSISFDVTLGSIPGEDPTMQQPAFSLTSNNPMLAFKKQAQFQHPQRLYSNEIGYDVGDAGFGAEDVLAEIDRERMNQGLPPKFTDQSGQQGIPDHAELDEHYDEDDDDNIEADPENETSVLNTPSHGRGVSEVPNVGRESARAIKQEANTMEHVFAAHQVQHKVSRSELLPAANTHPSLEDQQKRFMASKGLDLYPQQLPVQHLQEQPQQQVHQPQPRRAHGRQSALSKISSLQESSASEEEEEEQVIQPTTAAVQETGTKRPLPDNDLDYDLPTLHEMTMTQLDSIPFLTDPRHPGPSSTIDASGQSPSLTTKLSNLTRMQQADQILLFRSLTDAERTETAEWFLSKFENDMQRLTEVRVARRKIALKYEMEVRKRDRATRCMMEGVQAELDGLRKGGEELVKDRVRGGSIGP